MQIIHTHTRTLARTMHTVDTAYTTARQYCFFHFHSLTRSPSRSLSLALSLSLGSFYLKYVLYARSAVHISLCIKYFVLCNRREQLMNPE